VKPSHTIRSYLAGKLVTTGIVDEPSDLQWHINLVKNSMKNGIIDHVEIIDHQNALKSRRIYSPRRKRNG